MAKQVTTKKPRERKKPEGVAKIVKKKATTTQKKKRKKKEEPIDNRKFLSEQDIYRLELLNGKVVNAKLAMSVEEQALRNLNLKYELEINSQKQKLNNTATVYNNLVEKYKNINNSMYDKYELDKTGPFDYHPESGEINPEED